MTIADATFQACPEFDAKIIASAAETDPWVTYAKKQYSYQETLERVRCLSENATLLKGATQPHAL